MSTDHRQRAEGIEASKNPIVQQAWSKIHHAYTLEAANQIDFPECTRRVALAISEALSQSLRAREGHVIDDKAPYWAHRLMAEHLRNQVCCKRLGSCRESGDCVTEYCAPCYAQWFLSQSQGGKAINGVEPAFPTDRSGLIQLSSEEADPSLSVGGLAKECGLLPGTATAATQSHPTGEREP